MKLFKLLPFLSLCLFANISIGQTPFITTWKTNNPGVSNNTSITIPISGVDYDVDWNDDGVFDEFGLSGNTTHDFGAEGIYTIRIKGYYSRILFDNNGDRLKLLSVDQWGTNAWVSMTHAFHGCSNLVVNATDAPNLSSVTNMDYMFEDCSSLNQNINNWNVSSVNSMVKLFAGCSSFNKPLNQWNTQNVNNMFGMFLGASDFNQDLSEWQLNQVTNTSNMFYNASSFNQNISTWDVSSIVDMDYMFFGASSFDQNLGGWSMSQVNYVSGMLFGVTLSVENYDALLIGWSQQDLNNDLYFDAGNSQYCNGTYARQNMIDNYNWYFVDGGQSCPDYFVTKWKTDNPGSSNSTSITIPTFGSGYSYDIDWNNDGVFDQFGITGDITHDYVNTGTYTIRIRGSFPRIYFNNSGDRQKLLSVNQWGNIGWTSMENAFYGCTNLTINATDSPNFTGLVSLARMFHDCSNLNTDISAWNVSSVSNMSNLFNGAISFDQNIGTWNVVNVTDMSGMFAGIGLSNVNYDALLTGWSQQNLQNGVVFDGGKSHYCEGTAAKETIINNFNWTITDGGRNCPLDNFVLTWDTQNTMDGSTNNSSITISTFPAETYNYDVDWNNDGIFDQFGITGNITHDFGAPGIYGIRIKGGFPRIYFAYNNDRNKIISIDQWGSTAWTSMESAFHDCSYLDLKATDLPNLSNVTNMAGMFSQCIDLKSGNFGSWDVSNVTNMFGLFSAAIQFNHNINAWDVSNVTNMKSMFYGAIEYNQPLDNWDVSKVTDMAYMLGEPSFNQDIGSWDISSVVNMSNMFSGNKLSTSNYDAILRGWATLDAGETKIPSNITFSGGTNYYCSSVLSRTSLINDYNWTITDGGISLDCDYFDHFVTTWKTDNPGTSNNSSISISTDLLTSYSYDVDWDNDGIFDQFGITGDISYDFGAPGTYTIRIKGNFSSINFNNSGDNEKLLAVNQWGNTVWTNLEYAFYNCSNLQILADDVPDLSGLTNLNSIFEGCSNLNEDLNYWDVSNITSMKNMFKKASSFNQSLNNWNVSAVNNMLGIFQEAASFDQDLGSWDVSNVTIMSEMFLGTALSQNNYDQLLIGWSAQNLKSNVEFHVGNTQFCQGSLGRQIMVEDKNWNINDGGYDFSCDPSAHFISTWNTSNPGITANNQLSIFRGLGSRYNYSIDWGDGSIQHGINTSITHTYVSPGVYQIRIQGSYHQIGFGGISGDASKLVSVDQWGSISWSSMSAAFSGCDNLVALPTSPPNLTSVTDLSEMFEGCTSFNQNINNWDVSKVTNMEGMFQNSSFNQPLNNWKVHNVTNLSKMFKDNNVFNQPLNNWNLNSASNMSDMFMNAISFDQDLGQWYIISATDLSNMFFGVQLSGNNYDNLLIGWSTPPLQTNVTFSGGNSKYCTGEAARQQLINNKGWTITDGGKDCPQYDFVTTWKTNNPGQSNTTSISIPVHPGEVYNYNVDWNNDGVFDVFGLTTGITHDFGSTGTYTIRIKGIFPRIYFNNSGDKLKLLLINQWGNQTWTSMASAFYGCSNVNITASDVPKLSGINSMNSMFKDCQMLAPNSINSWNVSQVADMSELFSGCSQFNSPLNGWNVSNVEHMQFMFNECFAFNQPLGNWNVSSVSEMQYMFASCTVFNQNIESWNVGNVANMENMFYAASSFNQPLGSWNTSAVNNMSGLFSDATVFDQNISNWNVGNVLDMTGMFENAVMFDQNLGSWNVSMVSQMANMFANVTLSTTNYDALLIGWAQQSLQSGVTFSGGNSKFCLGAFLRQQIIDNFGWNISDFGIEHVCELPNHFVTTWKTDNPGTSNNTSVTIPTIGGLTYNYEVDWNNDGFFEQTGITGSVTHDYGNAGTYTIRIKGTFPAIQFSGIGDKEKILSVDQWGDNPWASMTNAFDGCINLSIPASDAPDISNITSLGYMFRNAISLNSSINHWDVSSITNMSNLFNGATSFNQPLNNWNVSNITSLVNVFYGATSFNQPLDNWDVSKVSVFLGTFSGATSFDQNLGSWNVSNASTMSSMFNGVTLSTTNYDSLLLGWSALTLKSNVTFTAGNSRYCAGEAARQNIINTYNWNISDGGMECLTDHFVTTWKTDNPGASSNTSITIPTFSGETYNYDVDWNNDGVFDQTGITGNVTHDFGAAGTYTIRIRGAFPRIYFQVPFGSPSDREKIVNVEQWGPTPWSTMEDAFVRCSNLQVSAVDVPNLSQAASMRQMFLRCTKLNSNINSWDVSNIDNMDRLFSYASSFNQPLDNWDVSNVTNMRYMFSYATSFNQPIGNWDVGNVIDMNSMFDDADGFNQPIGSWDVSNVINMGDMFLNNSGFNQPIGSWNVSQVTTMGDMFSNATVFDQDLSTWDVSNVQFMGWMFYGATAFDQSLGSWDISSVTGISMSNMFNGVTLSTANYDATLIGWSTLDVGETQIPTNITFSGGNSNYCLGETAHNTLTGIYGWTITDGGMDCLTDHFVTTWKTDNPGTSNSTSISIPTTGVGYNYDVDWDNDGIFDQLGLTGNVTHDFGIAGTYTIRIRGAFPRIYFYFGNLGQDREKILSVDQWGNIVWTSMEYAFSGCSNLQIPATDAPDLSGVTGFRYIFGGCDAFNSNINHWDVSNVTDLSFAFTNTNSFNQSLDNWDVSNVTDMEGMFQNASHFNQNIGSWDVSKVRNMYFMFYYNPVFNQDISNWNTGSLENMSRMFEGASAFSQPIGGWDVSMVSDMSSTFTGATQFNQDIGNWNTGNVTDMSVMFDNAMSFDQNLGNWDVSKVTNMSNMFNGVTLSTTNYDSLLLGWSTLTLKSNVTFTAGNSKYCEGEIARQSMVDNFGWNISDAGIECGYIWNGKMDNDWNNGNNWSRGIPGIGSNVIIPIVNTTHYPVINGIIAKCGSLKILSGATLTITDIGQLLIEN